MTPHSPSTSSLKSCTGREENPQLPALNEVISTSRICLHCGAFFSRLVFVVETVLYILAPQAPVHQLLVAQPHLSLDNQECLQRLPDALIRHGNCDVNVTL